MSLASRTPKRACAVPAVATPKRAKVSETFVLKSISTMMDDAIMSSTGKWDLEALKLKIASESGRRAEANAMAA